jgi:monothiol glutaredoxin
MTSPRPPSPCIGLCELDGEGICRGCYRSLGEIAAWSGMSADAQWQAVRAAAQRRIEAAAHGAASAAGNRDQARGDIAVDVVERIKERISSGPVVLFMKGTPDFPQCGFSAQTVAALRACGAQFEYVNIFEEPELREGLKKYSNWPTYPQLYVNGELVGGCDIALEMFRSGELRKLLESAGALPRAG